MKVPVYILTLAMTALLAVEGWTLSAVIDLKVQVATLGQRVDLAIQKPAYETATAQTAQPNDPIALPPVDPRNHRLHD